MNEKQRKFFIDNIAITYNNKVEELEASIEDVPELNNYIVGAFLDNSIKVLDSKIIKANLKKAVEALSGRDEFVESDTRYNRRKNVDDEEYFYIKVSPHDMLEMPKGYKEARAVWEKKKEEVDKKLVELKAQKDLLVLKITIGSNEVLDKLVNQVDSLGDLDLFSSKMTLIAEGIEKPNKQIEASK